MRRRLQLSLSPEEASDPVAVRLALTTSCGVSDSDLSGYLTLARSIDARGRSVKIHLTVLAFLGEPVEQEESTPFDFRDVRRAKRSAVIIGAGPGGLFAALRCLELGVRPVVIDRGKDVRARRRDLAALSREGILDPDSNYCFGEGGAGTYSDGKLYTRSSKRGDVDRILRLFVHFGADPDILVDAHPHIGTNRLPRIIAAMRECILAFGGEVHFGQRVTGIDTAAGRIRSVRTASGASFSGDAYVLATGHSARDVFHMLHEAGIAMESKPLAIGVRIEHPQTLIDGIQYHCPGQSRSAFLPPASYRLVEQVGGRGVFSFCMCPGGIIAPASTAPGELVVNGWSPSSRNNRHANSGMVVEASPMDARALLGAEEGVEGPLLMMHLQADIERRAYQAGGGGFTAPALRVTDFIEGRISADLPACSYPRGIRPADLREVLPPFIYRALREGIRAFGRRMRGYITREAVVVATESRTSSPVRIPREADTLRHPAIENLYPCGEGAGYAGGIVSAAMDGLRVADALAIGPA
jgi:uncharacterized FAD-dependent dehydrogenase